MVFHFPIKRIEAEVSPNCQTYHKFLGSRCLIRSNFFLLPIVLVLSLVAFSCGHSSLFFLIICPALIPTVMHAFDSHSPRSGGEN